MSSDIGLIVGSGLAGLGLQIDARTTVDTPYGASSSPILTAVLAEHRISCIARHGEAHEIAPHEVNYRANLWALHQSGVQRLIALNIVGAIEAGFEPGDIAVPDQLIDYTSGRATSYGDGKKVVHVDFTEPFDPILRGRIAQATLACGYSVRRGVYGVTQGPRLETAAEIDRLERDGCTMVGMTAMPEAVLARELGVQYALCAVAVNYAAGRSPQGHAIDRQIERYLTEGMARVGQLLQRLIPELA